MKKKRKIGSKIYVALVMVFLYLPIAVLILYSFNDGKTSVWKGFTLKWYYELFNNSAIMTSLYNTLIIAVLAALVSTVLGTLAAIGIYNMKKPVRSLVTNVSNIPIINPEIVTGVSFMLLFAFVGTLFNFEMGFATVLIAHISFCTPYVILNVMPKLRQMDYSIYEAALDLGCNPRQAFFKTVMPEIMPGVISGMLMSFTYSLDDFVITYFTRGPKFQTLPIEIYTMLRRRISPTINALSTLLFIITIAILIIVNVWERRAEKEHTS
ncbi:aBC-type spermidine/putrescine transport system permease component II [Clostridium sp. CAG:964]|nr:aBC-type spermidine/putrescine transport system permease component II [Clostridium sp. CAG:964]